MSILCLQDFCYESEVNCSDSSQQSFGQSLQIIKRYNIIIIHYNPFLLTSVGYMLMNNDIVELVTFIEDIQSHMGLQRHWLIMTTTTINDEEICFFLRIPKPSDFFLNLE